MAGINHVISGPNNVPQYQMSGVPFVVSGSATMGTVTQISFPYVTRDIHLVSRGSSLAVGFTVSGSRGTARFTLDADERVTLNVRTNQIFVTATTGSVFYEVVAGLTVIPCGEFPILTASNGFLGVG